MTTLQSPDGTLYETDDSEEVRDLTLGHGYTVVGGDEQPQQPDSTPEEQQPAKSEPAEPEQPASDPATPPSGASTL